MSKLIKCQALTYNRLWCRKCYKNSVGKKETCIWLFLSITFTDHSVFLIYFLSMLCVRERNMLTNLKFNFQTSGCENCIIDLVFYSLLGVKFNLK